MYDEFFVGLWSRLELSCILSILISLYFWNVEYICYDDGCHLRKFTRNPIRQNVTTTAKRLASVEIVIDKLHMAGHIDKWCLENCDPHLFRDLDKVSVSTESYLLVSYLCIIIML